MSQDGAHLFGAKDVDYNPNVPQMQELEITSSHIHHCAKMDPSRMRTES